MPRCDVAAAIKRGYDAELAEEEFNQLALKVHRFQYAHSPVVRALAESPARSWREIPLVPARLFALHDIATFSPREAIRIFKSSGTTRGKRGRHYFRDLSLYRSAALAGARWACGAGLRRVESLMESREDSSLACMIDWMIEEFSVRNMPEGDINRIVIGPAFAFVHLFDADVGGSRALPSGSLVIETGGYKGRSRELEKDDLYRQIESYFSIPRDHIISEYGMCEISSPMWERPGEARGFRVPGWIRVRIVDPETLADVHEGLIAIYDPANLDSSVGVLTGDLGRLEENRLIVIGRLPGIEAKGCSMLIG